MLERFFRWAFNELDAATLRAAHFTVLARETPEHERDARWWTARAEAFGIVTAGMRRVKS